jgi:hypothetical protein
MALNQSTCFYRSEQAARRRFEEQELWALAEREAGALEATQGRPDAGPLGASGSDALTRSANAPGSEEPAS